ncbi:helix-turn-helix domain-containing protein [Pseudobacillus sp. 179-B 2D1 NHS]|uniref:helix-turn-helix domain-containing protein n=1 Tax=Pseudobacillus sp. 179-B 2D1 NHS TaxID=3374292 RepID=UPI003878FB59
MKGGHCPKKGGQIINTEKKETALSYILKTFNIKNVELADYLGCSRKLITEWTSGRKPISKKHLPKLSSFFGVTERFFTKELTEEDKNYIEFIYVNEKVIEGLERFQKLPGRKLELEELDDLIIRLFRKIIYTEDSHQRLGLKLSLLEKTLRVLLEEDFKKANILWDAVDLIEYDDEFVSELARLVMKYNDD